MSSQTGSINPNQPNQQQHPNTSSSRSSITLLLASILTLLAAIAIAVVYGDIAADLFGLRRIFGGGIATSRSSLLRQQTPASAVQGFSSSVLPGNQVQTQGEVKMRTPVYFLSHGGVC